MSNTQTLLWLINLVLKKEINKTLGINHRPKIPLNITKHHKMLEEEEKEDEKWGKENLK
jgi:hypothetical protein